MLVSRGRSILMESWDESRTIVQTSIDAMEFLGRCQRVTVEFFQLEKLTTEVFSDSTYMERHSAIGACISSYRALELTFLRIQQEERGHAAAVDRVFEKIKSGSVSGPRRMTREEQLDS